MKEEYYCAFCQKKLIADSDGLFIHEEVEHPIWFIEMIANDEEIVVN